MLIYVKNIKKKNKNKTFYGRTDGQPKTIVRNLTKRLFQIISRGFTVRSFKNMIFLGGREIKG